MKQIATSSFSSGRKYERSLRFTALSATCWGTTVSRDRGWRSGRNENWFQSAKCSVTVGRRHPRRHAGLGSLQREVYPWAPLLIIIIRLIHLCCLLAALAVSAGSNFTLPDHQPLQLGVAVATVVPFSAPSFPIGIGPPAVTCRKTSTPIHTHTHACVSISARTLPWLPFIFHSLTPYTNPNLHHNTPKPNFNLASIHTLLVNLTFNLKFNDEDVRTGHNVLTLSVKILYQSSRCDIYRNMHTHTQLQSLININSWFACPLWGPARKLSPLMYGGKNLCPDSEQHEVRKIDCIVVVQLRPFKIHVKKRDWSHTGKEFFKVGQTQNTHLWTSARHRLGLALCSHFTVPASSFQLWVKRHKCTTEEEAGITQDQDVASAKARLAHFGNDQPMRFMLCRLACNHFEAKLTSLWHNRSTGKRCSAYKLKKKWIEVESDIVGSRNEFPHCSCALRQLQ